MLLRPYTSSDCDLLASLFYNTVHIVNAKDYTAEQLSAWADGTPDLNNWNTSLSSNFTIVAEKNDTIVGFGDIDKNGYLDRLFVHHEFQNQGIATAICNELEKYTNAKKIVTHSSITARPFFESRGYKIVNQQQVQRHGIYLTNYLMELIR